MTGADHFSDIVQRIAIVLSDPSVPAAIVPMVMLSNVLGAATGMAAKLYSENHYAEAQDLVTCAAAWYLDYAQKELASDPAAREVFMRGVARMHGLDVPLRPEAASVAISSSALSDAELADLGLAPEPRTLADVIEENLASSPKEPEDSFAASAASAVLVLAYRKINPRCQHHDRPAPCRRKVKVIRMAWTKNGTVGCSTLCEEHADLEQSELGESSLFDHEPDSGDYWTRSP